MTAVKKDPLNGDYADAETRKMVKMAGKLLYEYDGTQAMREVLMTWVPYRYRSEISIMWDNIGTWRA
jgi:hypothetical protein